METTNSKECLGLCPVCGSDYIHYAASEVLGDTLRYPAECLDCKQEFYEDYDITYAETNY